MSQLLIDNKVNRVDFVKEGSCSVADILIIKGKDGADMPETVQEILSKMKPEHQTALNGYIATIEKAKCDAEKEAADAKKKPEDDEEAKKKAFDFAELKKECDIAKARITELEADKQASTNSEEANFEEVLKSMPTSAQLVMKQLKQTNDELVAKAKEVQEVAENETAIAKAKDLAVLPVKQEELVAIIKSKPSTEVMQVLSNLAKAFENSDIFKAKGTETHEDTANKGAYEQVEALASDISKAKNVTIEKARLEVFNSNPDLYAKYNAGGAK